MIKPKASSQKPKNYTKNKDQRQKKKVYKKDIVVLSQNFSIDTHNFLKQLKISTSSVHLVKQCFRSSSSITANIMEAQSASSKKNLAHKYSISLKEARETYFWLNMLSVEFPNQKDVILDHKKNLKEIIAILQSCINKLLLSFLFFLFSCTASSQIKANVIISEVYPNPTTEESEWIELYNDATTSADLTGWILEDQLSSPSTLYTFLSYEASAQEDNSLDLYPSIIEPYQYLVIHLPTSKLNNSADGVTLINQSGEIIDEMSYSSSTQGQSWSLINGDWYLTEPTSEQENQPPPSATPSPSPSSSPSIHYDQLADDLSFSEVYYCPSSGDNEWLELKNDSDQLVDLSGWQLIDQSDNKKTLSQSTNPNSLAVIDWSSSFLNNSGDTLALHSPDGIEQLKISLPECGTGLSLIYHDSSWRLTTSPTPGDVNVYSPTSEEESIQSEDDEKTNKKNSETNENIIPGQSSKDDNTTQNFQMDYHPNQIKLETSPASDSGKVLGILDKADDYLNYDQLKYATFFLLIGGGIWSVVGMVMFQKEYATIFK